MVVPFDDACLFALMQIAYLARILYPSMPKDAAGGATVAPVIRGKRRRQALKARREGKAGRA